MSALGTHLILELKQCNDLLLNDLSFVKNTMIEAARAVGATIIGDSFHQFDPIGVTGVVAISESHLCIHTWPEYGYAAADIFTCGDSFEPRKAAELLVRRIQAHDHSITEVKRGLFVVPTSAPSQAG